MHKIVLTAMARRPRRASHPSAPQVHFHQGPQGQAVPCYDTHCPNPRLSV